CCDSASGDTASTDGGASGGADDILVNGTEPQNPLVPAKPNEPGGARIGDSRFPGLMGSEADAATDNALAESIDPNADNTDVPVNLKDWKFTDGSDVTANSFVEAWNYAVANAQLGAYCCEPVKGYAEEGVDELEGLEVIDDKTFKVTMNAPTADFPQRLGYSAFAPLPESAFEDMDAFGENPVGNGPYMLEEWNHNSNAL